MMHCKYFDTTRKGNHSATLTPIVVGEQCPLPSEICAQSDPPPFEKCRLLPISACNVSTVRDSKKGSIMSNIKSARAFQRAIDGVRTLPLSALKGGSKSDFFRFYLATACNATHGIAVETLSVCQTHVLWRNRTMHCRYFVTTQQWLVGDAPFPPKSALKVTPLRKTPTSRDFRLYV